MRRNVPLLPLLFLLAALCLALPGQALAAQDKLSLPAVGLKKQSDGSWAALWPRQKVHYEQLATDYGTMMLTLADERTGRVYIVEFDGRRMTASAGVKRPSSKLLHGEEQDLVPMDKVRGKAGVPARRADWDALDFNFTFVIKTRTLVTFAFQDLQNDVSYFVSYDPDRERVDCVILGADRR